jgi:hypothetical protein
MNPRDNPLSTKDRSDINASMARLNQILPDVEFLKSIGQDMTEYEMRRQKLLEDFAAFKQMYFPGLS